jgi:hypothetical protein
LRTAKALKNWRRKHFSGWKISWAIINIVLSNLERAQEVRLLTPEEMEFKKYLKIKAFGIAAMQKARARQHSRLTWIRKGDTNTRFFPTACKREKKKTFISLLNTQSGMVTSQTEKSKLVHSHFSEILGNRPQEQRPLIGNSWGKCTMNWRTWMHHSQKMK